MYKLRMFGLWVWIKASDPFRGEDVMHEVNRQIALLFAYVTFGFCSLLYLLSIGSKQWGEWDFVLVPAGIAALIVIPHAFSVIRRLYYKASGDYQTFVIDGGKHKRKNDDE